MTEIDTLKARKRRLETALSRLNTLYLYDDEAMPEKDFVMQRGDITKQLAQVDARLAELQASSPPVVGASEDPTMKASYYIMIEQLVQDSYLDYEKYIRSINPSVPRNFLLSVIDHIVVNDGRVISITFKNGATHTFTYKT